ncbi:hypothetical protein [Limosilactobacillus fermentum]|uniref:hypothetical protein n=1 Tax=Limosilactobacillus fermentum TaxID=1613 RepID=UPI000F4D6CAD|nr:hypothetical protein [Limosilactobacillus fermentum]
MHEYSSVKEALKDLVDINEGLVHEQDGKPATARTIQELNSEIVYQICDLLGCDDLYMEQNKKATHDDMDDLIKAISAVDITAGRIESDSLHLPKQA